MSKDDNINCQRINLEQILVNLNKYVNDLQSVCTIILLKPNNRLSCIIAYTIANNSASGWLIVFSWLLNLCDPHAMGTYFFISDLYWAI